MCPPSADAAVADLADKVKDASIKKPKGNAKAPKATFLEERSKFFDELKKKSDEIIASKPRKAIKITLTDGKVLDGTSWETTPFEIARNISKSLLERVFISKVNGTVWDLERPFEEDSTLELLDFENDEAKQVFWHSSAHVLGEACENQYGAHLCFGPPTDDGFFYDMSIDDGKKTVAAEEFSQVESWAKTAIKEKQKFERLVVSKEDLKKMFHYNKYKLALIDSKIPDGTSTTVYRCGPLIDLCRGPHIPHTGRIKAFKLLKNSSSYFLGDASNDSLQRIYGVSFPDKKLMDAHLKFLEEAAKRDHRKIGKEQELFMFHEMSPGSCFWLPHGARIYNTLNNFLRDEYRKRGYEEVITPNMFNAKLWKTSGHWENYKENMFTIDVEKDSFGLKPMNCPGHCLMFKARERSYRELPWRVADFGVIHRNEFSGALSGLTRVRRFQQDDAHIFCRQDQIEDEITGVFDFLQTVYGIFGFEFKMELSTRPEKYVGDIKTWDDAEAKLTNALNNFGKKWEINPGDGAFYGPKIDIMISDALKRWHQCATIQLDFQLPRRFELEYHTDSSDEPFVHPVMIHRAIYGSFERMIGILTEHFFGKWPFWMSPRQVLVVPVGVKFNDYAQKVRDTLWDAGYFADVDLGPNTLQKKVRTGQLQQYNFIFIVGDEEEKSNTVNVRNRDDTDKQQRGVPYKLEEIIDKLDLLRDKKTLVHEGI